MHSSTDTKQLRQNVRLLGETLGNVIRESEGADLFDTVEQIRQCSKQSQEETTLDELFNMLNKMSDDRILAVARAFNQFLNLANIADQHHTTSSQAQHHFSAAASLDRATERLLQTHKAEEISAALDGLKIDLVLTAHPTEITRRTLIHKHGEINRCLTAIDRNNLSETESKRFLQRLAELVAQIWHTEEFRTERPTPEDEARWGFAVIENSLWDAAPEFQRTVDELCDNRGLGPRPTNWQPIQISSWIGGDRDGNPNVTAEVTKRVLLLAQWQACDLFLRDVATLYEELSLTTASTALCRAANHAREPYRALLKPLREKLSQQQANLANALGNRQAAPIPLQRGELLEPLQLCFDSLTDCGITGVADGLLLDTLRRVHCFGPHLIKLDIRQESGRHTACLSALTKTLEVGDYAQWSESERQTWLHAELNNPRPLIPADWEPEADVQEVLDTFNVIASTPPEALGCYVISMAGAPSDVLGVQLLLKAMGCPQDMPVAPLFETLDDLTNAPEVITELLTNREYYRRIGGKLVVMIGYSDSAKDAGMLAAGWAQYRAQEALLEVCERHSVALQLFHGRGGSIGRGGAPAHQALLSQPPRSLLNGLRVTEQGEMIRTKLGLTPLAVNTLGQYASAILQANLQPPPAPAPQWRALMEQLAQDSCDQYRQWVRQEPNFVPYFRQATPEQELANLPLGSRPARRRSDGGIESLRAIPWIFAWSQNRLMLPAWLGAGAALNAAIERGMLDTLQSMADEWPFFRSRLSMLEMVFAKKDLTIAALYDRMLVIPELKPIGAGLRAQLVNDEATLLEILASPELLAHDSWALESIGLRNIYTAPLNLLQAELLRRVRETHDPAVEQALMVTIAGVAAGMRNTG